MYYKALYIATCTTSVTATSYYYSELELRTQNAFVPALEDGIKFSDGSGEWQDSPVPSSAVCRLDEVEAILANKLEHDDSNYKITLKGDGVDISILIRLRNLELLIERYSGKYVNNYSLRSDSTGMVCNNQNKIVIS